MMAKTVAQITAWVDTMIPNAMDSTTKYILLEDIFDDVKRYNIEYVVSDTTPTVANQSIYSLPTGVHWRDLVYVGVSNTTFNSTNVMGSTTLFTEHKYRTLRQNDVGLSWIENSSSSIILSGIPGNAYHMRFRYLPSLTANSSSDSTTIVPANDEIIDYIQNKLAAMVAKSGAFPRVDLANNYEMEAQDAKSKVMIESAKFRWNRNKDSISYKEWW